MVSFEETMSDGQLGQNLRSIRQARDISLNALAESSGYSKGYLSKVENGHAQPPIATLMKVAQCLGVTMNQLFEGRLPSSDRDQPVAVLTRRTEREVMHDEDGKRGYDFERLAVGSPFQMTPYVIHLLDDDAPAVTFQHEGEEMIYMLIGRCQYRVGTEIHELRKGDTLLFDARIEHGAIKLPGINATYLAIFTESNPAL